MAFGPYKNPKSYPTSEYPYQWVKRIEDLASFSCIETKSKLPEEKYLYSPMIGNSIYLARKVCFVARDFHGAYIALYEAGTRIDQ